jgi:ribosomal-protein-alanine N-acetyltransferase
VTRIRLLAAGDAGVLSDVVQRNRSFLAPWEPVRPDSYFTVDGQREAIAESLSRYEARAHVPYVILDGSGNVVGRINLNNVVRGAFQSASVGYWLAEEAGGRGFATEAVAEVVAAAFGELGLHRLEAGTVPETSAPRPSWSATASSSTGTRRATCRSPDAGRTTCCSRSSVRTDISFLDRCNRTGEPRVLRVAHPEEG